MQRRRFNFNAPREPQLALFHAAPAPGIVQPPRRRIEQPQFRVDVVGFLCGGYTPWSRERPPSSGYWELRQRGVEAPEPHNWWYSPQLNAWHRGVPAVRAADARFVPHAELMQHYEWRGAKQQWPEGYPYELERPAFGSPVALGDAATTAQASTSPDPVPIVSPAAVPFTDLNPTPSRRRIAL